MVPPPGRFRPWDWVAERARKAETLGLHERRLVVPLQEFSAYVGNVRSQFKDLRSFKPIVEYIDQLRDALEEGVGWLRECVEGDMSWGELASRLQEDTAEGLDNLLGGSPGLDYRMPANSPKEFEALVDDVESFLDNLCQEITRRGYQLHGVLVGSA